MKNLYESSTLAETVSRLSALTPASERRWGKMNPAQALAHCCVSMEMAVGDRRPKRMLIGRLLGPVFKGKALDETPLRRNSPTDPSFIVTEERDFVIERERLQELLRRFHTGGTAGCTTHPHSFFGEMTPQEWARQQYKHVDHHLQQFGA